MDKIWDRKSFEVRGHWPLWRGWKKRMTMQNRQKSNAKTTLVCMSLTRCAHAVNEVGYLYFTHSDYHSRPCSLFNCVLNPVQIYLSDGRSVHRSVQLAASMSLYKWKSPGKCWTSIVQCCLNIISLHNNHQELLIYRILSTADIYVKKVWLLSIANIFQFTFFHDN